jgi:tRNA-2-methylthio-N6-dimethylallyladenosine synthase
VEQARYRNCFIFKYSPRPGTVALHRHADDVPDEEKRQRNRDLLTLQNTITHELNQQEVGREVTVLCEGPSGWRESAESIIAGAPRTATRSPAGPTAASPRVELGPRLAAALDGASSRHAAASPRLSQPVTRNTQLATSRQPCVQLTGRTATDQIVVFDGSPTLEGCMVRVRIHAVHGLTAFGRLKYPAARE